jgi:hypothetical protein
MKSILGWGLGIVGLSVVICTALFAPRYWQAWNYQPVEGDIVFQSLPSSPLANAIEGATHSPWSHCGIVARDEQGAWVVYEALNGVEATPLHQFLLRSRDNAYAVYRLRDEQRRHVPAMLDEVRACLGRPYDVRYRWDDEKIYCTELIYKAYECTTGEALGELVALGSLDWQQYTPLIEELEGGPVPVDRQMITPRDMAAAPQLERVYPAGKKL